jgi:hypothetical protein
MSTSISQAQAASTLPFLNAYRGTFTGVLRWPQFDRLWETLQRNAGLGWYLYRPGEFPPDAPLGVVDMFQALEQIRGEVQSGHREDYCGIVYADSLEQPSLVKIYHPGNLGSSCGFSETPPLPGWIFSRLPPADLTRGRNASRWSRWLRR